MSDTGEQAASVKPEVSSANAGKSDVSAEGSAEVIPSGTKEMTVLQGSEGAPTVSIEPAPMSENEDNFEKWVENFYKECGRETTLAYTTLNQMKNWAMVIAAAFISA